MAWQQWDEYIENNGWVATSWAETEYVALSEFARELVSSKQAWNFPQPSARAPPHEVV